MRRRQTTPHHAGRNRRHGGARHGDRAGNQQSSRSCNSPAATSGGLGMRRIGMACRRGTMVGREALPYSLLGEAMEGYSSKVNFSRQECRGSLVV